MLSSELFQFPISCTYNVSEDCYNFRAKMCIFSCKNRSKRHPHIFFQWENFVDFSFLNIKNCPNLSKFSYVSTKKRVKNLLKYGHFVNFSVVGFCCRVSVRGPKWFKAANFFNVWILVCLKKKLHRHRVGTVGYPDEMGILFFVSLKLGAMRVLKKERGDKTTKSNLIFFSFLKC